MASVPKRCWCSTRASPRGANPRFITVALGYQHRRRRVLDTAGSSRRCERRGSRTAKKPLRVETRFGSRALLQAAAREDLLSAAWRADGRQAAEMRIHHLAGLRPRGNGGRNAPRWPRIGGLSRSTSGDLHSKFAGLGSLATYPDRGALHLRIHRCMAPTVSDDQRAKVAARLAAGEEEGKRRQAARPCFCLTRHSGRQPWRLLDTAESASHGESAASASGRRTNQTGCTNLTTANFADLVRAAQAGRAGSPRPKWLPPESSPCRRHTKGRETRCFARQPPREARPSSAARRWPF